MTNYQPPGYHAVTPWIISRDTAQLIEFTKQAFGAVELARIPGPAGGIEHAEVRIGDSVVMMFDAREGWPDTPAFLRLYVPDCETTYRQALEAGGTAVTGPTSLFFGEHVTDVDPADLVAGPRDETEAEALRYVRESLDGVMRVGH